MSNLLVIGYDDQLKAEEVRLILWKIQKEHFIDLQDSAVAVKDGWGKVKLLHQPFNPTTDDAAGGGFWATILGVLLAILGAILVIFYILYARGGGPEQAISEALTEENITDKLMKHLAEMMKLGSSALFILLRRETPDQILEELKGMGGKVLKTSFAHDDEAKIQDALSAT